jgi:hypothetical protein
MRDTNLYYVYWNGSANHYYVTTKLKPSETPESIDLTESAATAYARRLNFQGWKTVETDHD